MAYNQCFLRHWIYGLRFDFIHIYNIVVCENVLNLLFLCVALLKVRTMKENYYI